jgi:hypothetical protein
MEKVSNTLQDSEKPLVHSLDSNTSGSVFTKQLFIFIIAAIVLGGASGYLLGNYGERSAGSVMSGSIDSSGISKGAVIGSDDLDAFKDTAVGDLKGGGINGEGQFHLVRPGGESQNVYLTSASVDLSKFIGKKIKVWGETQQAQYAGWLMNVGRVEVVE